MLTFIFFYKFLTLFLFYSPIKLLKFTTGNFKYLRIIKMGDENEK